MDNGKKALGGFHYRPLSHCLLCVADKSLCIMPNIIEITDIAAPELDPYVRLTEAQLKNRLHPEDGLFIAESPKVIGYALDAGYEPVSLLMERRHIGGKAAALLARVGDIPVYTAEEAVLRDLTGYPLTRGVLCAMRRRPLPPVEAVCRDARRVAVLEGIVDTTNIGAIFRSAAALGVDGVLLTPTTCDPLNRRAVRVSMGTVFQVPWTRIGESARRLAGGGAPPPRRAGLQDRGAGAVRRFPGHRRPQPAGRAPAGDGAGHRGGRPGPGHHRPLRLHRPHPHGPRRGFPERRRRRGRGLLDAVQRPDSPTGQKTLYSENACKYGCQISFPDRAFPTMVKGLQCGAPTAAQLRNGFERMHLNPKGLKVSAQMDANPASPGVACRALETALFNSQISR